MALQEVALRVPFAGGIDTKTDPKSVPVARLLTLENAVFTRAVSLSKRYGYTSLGLAVLGSATPYALPRGLAARGDELVLFTEDAAYNRVSDAWAPIADGCSSVRQSDRALVKTVSDQTDCDYAECSGVSLVCWVDSRGGVYYALGERDGRMATPPTQASSDGISCRAVRCGDRLVLLWAEDVVGQVKAIVFDPSAPHTYDSARFPAVVVDDLVASAPYFDAAYVPSVDPDEWGSAAAIAWNSTTGVRSGWLDPSGVVGSVGTGWPGVITIATAAAVTAGPVIAIDRTDSPSWAIAWATATNVYAATVSSLPTNPTTPIALALTPTALTVTGASRLAVALRTPSSQIVDVWAEERGTPVMTSTIARRRVDSGGAVSSPLPSALRGACLASSAWTDVADGGTERAFVNVLHPAPLFSSYFAVRDDGQVVAQTLPANAGLPPGRLLPRVTDPEGARAWSWCAVYRNKLGVSAGVNADNTFSDAGPRLVTLDMDASDAHQTATAGRTLYLGGAVTQAYDGVGWSESAPLYGPDWVAGATLHTAGSGGGLAPGTYSYIFWYEWTFANGEIARGPTSKPYSVTVTGGSDDRITIQIPTLRIGAWGRQGGQREDCRIGVGRSLAGDASVYYRVSSTDPSTDGADNGYVTNSQTSDTVQFVDALPDEVAQTGEPLYTTGGVPSNDPIATSGLIAEAGGRLWFGDASDPDALYFSQERAAGYAIEATPLLRVTVPPFGGEVTGIADLDGAKIIFKRSAIYGLAGSGPLANPDAGGEWSSPALITSDAGCLDQRSIVATPVGLMFQSSKGIYLLDRGKNATYIGAPVEAYNDLAVVRATLVESANQVRFLTSTVALLCDYAVGGAVGNFQWSVFTNHGGLDAANADGVYHYLRTDGRVFRQSTGYADDNLQIPMVIETAWIRFAEARQGMQRIWHAQTLGAWKSPHKLRVQYQTDYDAPGNWSEPMPPDGHDATDMGGGLYGSGVVGDGVYGGSGPAPYQFSNHIGRACQAIRFRFTFLEEPGAFGACAELTELLITGGVKGNRGKIAEARMS